MATFSYESKKIEKPPQPIKTCCVTCFRRISQERAEKKQCEDCEKKNAKPAVQPWSRSKRREF